MRPAVRLLLLACTATLAPFASAFPQTAPSLDWLAPLRDDAGRLMKAALADDFAWRRLAEFTDTHGARLSGSENLTRAIAWAAAGM